MSRRLYDLSLTASLWTSVDSPPNDVRTLDRILTRRVNSSTHSVRLAGGVDGENRGSKFFFPPSILVGLRSTAPNLTHLHLIRQRIDGHVFLLSMLPSRLTLLDLTGTYVNVEKYVRVPNDEQPYSVEDTLSYFRDAENELTDLEVLDLSYCNWLVVTDLIHIRKLRSLTKLSIRGVSFRPYKGLPKTFAVSGPERRLKWTRTLGCIRAGGFPNLTFLDWTNSSVELPVLYDFVNSLAVCKATGGRTMDELHIGRYDWPTDGDRGPVRSPSYERNIRADAGINPTVLDVSGCHRWFRALYLVLRRLERAIFHFNPTDVDDGLRTTNPNIVIARAPRDGARIDRGTEE